MSSIATPSTSLILALLAAGLLITLLPDPSSQRMRSILPVRPGTRARTALPHRLRRFLSAVAAGDKVAGGTDDDADALRLAAAWDILAASLRAGMPVPEAMRAAAGSAPDRVRQVFLRTADLLALGAEPTKAWDQARACPDVAEFARSAARTARSGTALAETAADLASRARETTGDRAQARAQRAGVLMTGPLGLCFLPAFLCLGVVPVVIGLADQLTVLR